MLLRCRANRRRAAANAAVPASPIQGLPARWSDKGGGGGGGTSDPFDDEEDDD